MTITVNFIEGNVQSISRNDAYAVVENGKTLLSIISASEAQDLGVNAADIRKAFTKASKQKNFNNEQKLVYAQKELHDIGAARKLKV